MSAESGCDNPPLEAGEQIPSSVEGGSNNQSAGCVRSDERGHDLSRSEERMVCPDPVLSPGTEANRPNAEGNRDGSSTNGARTSWPDENGDHVQARPQRSAEPSTTDEDTRDDSVTNTDTSGNRKSGPQLGWLPSSASTIVWPALSTHSQDVSAHGQGDNPFSRWSDHGVMLTDAVPLPETGRSEGMEWDAGIGEVREHAMSGDLDMADAIWEESIAPFSDSTLWSSMED